MPPTYFNSLDQVTVQPTQTAILQTIMRQARREALALLQLLRVIDRTHSNTGLTSITGWRTTKKFMRAYTIYDQTKREFFALQRTAEMANLCQVQDHDYDQYDLDRRYGPAIAHDIRQKMPKRA